MVLAMTGALLAVGAQPASAEVETTKSYHITSHCPQHFGSSNGPDNLTDALNQARNCDTMAVNAKLYAPYAAAMLQANPRLRLLAYFNAGLCAKTRGPLSADPCPGTYLKDASGAYVRAIVTRNWLMRPQSTAWADNVELSCKTIVAGLGVGTNPRVGCMLDMLGLGALNGMMTAFPVVPGTKTAYTPTTWMSEMQWLTDRLASDLGAAGLFVEGNGLHSGQYYEAWTAPLLTAMPFMAENAWRNPPKLGGTLLNRWLSNSRMFAAASKPITITAKGWAGDDLEFTLGSHVLLDQTYVAPGKPWNGLGNPYSWTTLTTNGTEYHPEVRKLREGFLAAPTGPFTTYQPGVFRRAFVRTFLQPDGSTRTAAQGVAYVNANDTTSVSIKLNARYELLDGRFFGSGSILKVGPQKALIMRLA